MTTGQQQMVQFRLAEPLPLVPGDRFVRARQSRRRRTRAGLATIGGGRILGVSNIRLRRKKPWTLNALAARRDALDDPERWCELMLREGPPLSTAEVQRKCLLARRGNDRIAGKTARGWTRRRAVGRLVHTQRGGGGDSRQNA